MSTEKDLPALRTQPDTIRKSKVWILQNGDFAFEFEVMELLAKIYDHPEDSFYLFSKADEPLSHILLSAIETGALRIVETQSRFFRHPKFDRDYVRITDASIHFEWEREVSSNSPMFLRHELALTEKTRRSYEMQQVVALHQEANSNPLEFKPSIYGFGIDIPKAWLWLKQKLGFGRQ